MTRTLVALHAHPDDEAVLTAGTMARAAAEGHRVVLVLATDGDQNLDPDLAGRPGPQRLAEAEESARLLGCTRVRYLGYADSGPDPGAAPPVGAPPVDAAPHAPTRRTAFVHVPVDQAAQRLATILRAERADVLLGYDRNGGYGHPDHRRVHEVATEAARLAGTARVLQATAPRELMRRALELASRFDRLPSGVDLADYEWAFSARTEITHRIPVGRYAGLKRAALRAHSSQTSARGGADPTLAAALRIPRPLFDLVFAREWFVDPRHHGPVRRDVFAGLP